MDFGRFWRGRRILGDGKTWRGFIGGASAGIIIGLLQLLISEPFSSDHFGFGSVSSALPIIFALSFGSLLGDVCGAFIKRQAGLERGQKAPFLDQYDFVLGALLLAFLVNTDWIIEKMISGNAWIGFIVFLLLVLGIHRGVNIIGYKMGKKDVPW